MCQNKDQTRLEAFEIAERLATELFNAISSMKDHVSSDDWENIGHLLHEVSGISWSLECARRLTNDEQEN